MRLAISLLLALSASLIAALQFLDPGVGPLEKPISSYALGEWAGVWLIAVTAGGIAMMLQARRWRQRLPASIGPRMLAAAGIAFVFIGVFSTDPWYPWQHALTFTGWIHVISTGAGMALLSACMLLGLMPRSPEGMPALSRVVGLTYGVVLVFSVCFTLGVAAIGREPPLIGLEERLLLVLALVWLGLEVRR